VTQAEIDPYTIPRDYPGCLGCGHYQAGRCVAFPKRIPLIILAGDMHHLAPLPGKFGDTVFTPLEMDVWRATGRRVPAKPEPAIRP
jgi:hypothetical protein